MAWLRIDDRVRTHPKIAQAGPAAAWLWFCGVCYCREHLTDGFLPKPVIPTLALNLPNPWRHAARLVEVRLWEDAVGGYLVHDFLDWNPSKAEVLSMRDKERDKKRTQRGTDSGHERDTHARARDRAGDAGSGSGSEAREGEVSGGGAGGTMPAPLIDGRSLRRHGQHARCYLERGLCVTPWVWEELVGRLGGDASTREARLRVWMDGEVLSIGDLAIGDPPDAWWRKRFARWQGVDVMPTGAPERRTATSTTLSTLRRTSEGPRG